MGPISSISMLTILFHLLELSRATPVGARNAAVSVFDEDLTVSLDRRHASSDWQPALFPAVHWEHDAYSLDNLLPSTIHNLYFSPDGTANPSQKHTFARSKTELSAHAVILDHSSHVQSVRCDSNELLITFTDKHAFDFARKSWTSISPLTLATNSELCGQLKDQRSFWEVTSLDFGHKLSVRVTVTEESSLENVIHGAELEWGTWMPHETTRMHLERRFSFGSLISSVKSFASSAISSVTSTVTTVAKAALAIGQAAVDVAVTAVKTLAGEPLSVSADIPISASPDAGQVTDTPFPNSVLLTSLNESSTSSSGSQSGSLNVYCVNCFLKGDIMLAGQAQFSITQGVTKLQASAMANFQANVALGIEAMAMVERKYTKSLFQKTLPPPAGFSIAGLIMVGPFVELQAKAEAMVSLAGTAVAGITMNIPQFGATLDFLDSSKSTTSPFTPTFTPSFQANAKVAAFAGISLPVLVGIGVTIPKINFSKSATLVEQPMLSAAFSADVSINGSSVTSSSTCKGITYDIEFMNDLYLDAFDKTQFTISHYSVPIAQGCFGASSRRSVTSDPDYSVSKREEDQPLKLNMTFFRWSNEETNMEKTEGPKLDQLGWESGMENSKSTALWPNGTQFISIEGATQPWMLVADDKGFLRPGELNLQNGKWFAMWKGVVFGDADARVLSYNAAMMKQFNVSTLRLWTADVWPGDCDAIVLVPGETGSDVSPYVYVASTADGNSYPIYTCNYEDKPSRLFLAADLGLSKKSLMDGTLPEDVTGGKITSCAAIPWAVPRGAHGVF